MPRDSDKNNDSPRGRRDRPPGKSRSGAARGPEKKFAKRGFGGKDFAGKRDGDKRDGERRPYAAKSDGAKPYGKKPYSGAGKPYAGKREGASPRRDDDRPRRDFGDSPRPRFNRDDRPRGDRPDREPRKDFRPREDRGGEKRPYTPRGDRPSYNRDDRAPRRDRKGDPRDRDDARPAGRFAEKKFGDKRPYTPRGEGFRKERPSSRRSAQENLRHRNSPAARDASATGDRQRDHLGPRRILGSPASATARRSPVKRDDRGGRIPPPRDGARNFDKPREERGGEASAVFAFARSPEIRPPPPGAARRPYRLAGASAQRVAIRPICRSAAPRQ
jgi:23S rRNA pseudouridine2605 synthase